MGAPGARKRSPRIRVTILSRCGTTRRQLDRVQLRRHPQERKKGGARKSAARSSPGGL